MRIARMARKRRLEPCFDGGPPLLRRRHVNCSCRCGDHGRRRVGDPCVALGGLATRLHDWRRLRRLRRLRLRLRRLLRLRLLLRLLRLRLLRLRRLRLRLRRLRLRLLRLRRLLGRLRVHKHELRPLG